MKRLTYRPIHCDDCPNDDIIMTAIVVKKPPKEPYKPYRAKKPPRLARFIYNLLFESPDLEFSVSDIAMALYRAKKLEPYFNVPGERRIPKPNAGNVWTALKWLELMGKIKRRTPTEEEMEVASEYEKEIDKKQPKTYIKHRQEVREQINGNPKIYKGPSRFSIVDKEYQELLPGESERK